MIKARAVPIMLQSTQSNAGKSVLATGLLRMLADAGLDAAPFKAQNMALNSFVTEDGAEIGRAQALQAMAARIAPTRDLNPILLKPATDSRSQVIIHGKVFSVMSAREYHAFKRQAMSYVLESYERLSSAHDAIVIEGAGSPAEVNLRENDIANMGIAEAINSPVVIIGDIDRGGVFASIVGTMELLSEEERERVRGFIINKFRGDMELLRPGIEFLEHKTKRPVLGVLPFIKGLLLHDEDSVCLDRVKKKAGENEAMVNIAVIALPRISNFTDLDPFKAHGEVNLYFARDPSDLGSPDLVVIPGSKNTIEDLRWLKHKGFSDEVIRLKKRGAFVFGICGGFQMLGTVISDPLGVESDIKEEKGLCLLKADTVLKAEKATHQVEAEARGCGGFRIKGYEIHMGETDSDETPFARILKRGGIGVRVLDGAVSRDQRVFGTYIHGVFDNDGFRSGFLSLIKDTKGIKDHGFVRTDFSSQIEKGISSVAEAMSEAIGIDKIIDIMGIVRDVIPHTAD